MYDLVQKYVQKWLTDLWVVANEFYSQSSCRGCIEEEPREGCLEDSSSMLLPGMLRALGDGGGTVASLTSALLRQLQFSSNENHAAVLTS